MSIAVTVASFLMPLSMLIAAQGMIWTISVFICLPVFLFLFYQQSLRTRKITRFFFSWTITSFLFLLCVFELEVVPYLEILFMENFVLMCFVSLMCLCAYLTRAKSCFAVLSSTPNNSGSMTIVITEYEWPKCEACSLIQPPRSNHCRLCGFCVLRQDHHCVWLDICVGAKNHRFFLCGLLALIVSTCYSANLTLTTICHPTLVGGLILLPDDCSDVYGDIHIAICFVSAVYTSMIAVVSLVMFFQQFWLVCHNTTFQEWKRGQLGMYNKGVLKNCAEFLYGY